MKRINVGILLFDDVETLDFAGPFEVFSITGQRNGNGDFNVFTIAKNSGPILAVNGLSINPNYLFNNCPEVEILIVPGGYGTRRLIEDDETIQWIKQKANLATLVLSVCTGSLLLAQAGLLSGLSATTHHLCYDLLERIDSSIKLKEERFVDNGRILTAAGIAAGIDMSLHVVSRVIGKNAAVETANYMEYPYYEKN